MEKPCCVVGIIGTRENPPKPYTLKMGSRGRYSETRHLLDLLVDTSVFGIQNSSKPSTLDPFQVRIHSVAPNLNKMSSPNVGLGQGPGWPSDLLRTFHDPENKCVYCTSFASRTTDQLDSVPQRWAMPRHTLQRELSES
eukprot:9307134-Pyramimonas_sp.AAC.1